jgi:hypothetical protein
MRQLFSLAICLVVLFPHNPCLADDFCNDLNSVIAASAKLSDLAGKQELENFWEATRLVSGFRVCQILLLPDTSTVFTCELQKQKSFSSAKEDFERVEKSIVSCLPSPAWHHLRWTEKSLVQPENVGHSFEQADGSSGLVSIDNGTDDTPQMNPFYYVSLTVYERKK